MVKILKTKQKSFEKEFCELLKKRDQDDNKIDATVAKIIEKVRIDSDKALLEFTNKFDKFLVKRVEDLIVKKDELENCLKVIKKSTRKSLKKAISRIKSYHQKQKPSNLMYKDKQGILLGGIWNPIESVGLYVPGGTAAYPSSLLMNAIPAIVAGVKRIVVTVPANKGKLNSSVLACCQILGINEIYKIGGAQAIAALALGTPTIKPVDKILAPPRIGSLAA